MRTTNFSEICCLLSLNYLIITVTQQSFIEISQNDVPLTNNLPCEDNSALMGNVRATTDPPRKDYSALVVFGDSYSDDGHSRKQEDKHSFSEPPAVGGRFCDGPVWDEFLARNLSVDSNDTFLNYAFNGAHISNKLSNPSTTPVPDTAAQIEDYLHSLQANGQPAKSIGDGRILHALWIGINPLIVMWTSKSYGNTTLHADTLLTLELVEKIDQQINELSKQVTQLFEHPTLSKLQAHYMLLTVPPLTTSKLAQDQATAASKEQGASREDYLELLSQMTDYFNTGLSKAVDDFKQKIQEPIRKDAIFMFVTGEFWSKVRSDPEKFGIDSLGTCYSGSGLPVCGIPDNHMYWDVLHPSSTLHAQLSIAIQEYLDQRV